MDHIAPSLVLLWDVLWSLERGLSVNHGIQSFLRRSEKNSFKLQIEMWWAAQKNPSLTFSKIRPPGKKCDQIQLSAIRRQLLETLELGLQGESILAQLRVLESEMLISCEEEIQRHTALLPVKMMLPLFGLIFPSLMILLIFPLLRMLQF
jgi:hypothetical protein